MKLHLPPATVRRARELAARVGQPVVDLARAHTTVAVERATLRLAGLPGADAEGTPWVNRLVDVLGEDLGEEALAHGVVVPVWDALLRGEADDLPSLAQKAAAGSVRFRCRRAPTRARPVRPRTAPSPRAWPGSMPGVPSATDSCARWGTRRGPRGSTSSSPRATSTRTCPRRRPPPAPGPTSSR